MSATTRISTSIVKKTLADLLNLNFGTGTINQRLTDRLGEIADVEVREALKSAGNTTYVDDTPYNTLVKRPFLLHGKLFENILTFQEQPENMVVYKNRLGKVAQTELRMRCEEIGLNAMPVSETILGKIKDTVDKIHNIRTKAPFSDLLGHYDWGGVLSGKTIKYNVVMEHEKETSKGSFLLTGEADAIVCLQNGKHLLLEIKTSAKVFREQGVPAVIAKLNYDFQVAKYLNLMSVCGYTPLKTPIFLVGNYAKQCGYAYPLNIALGNKKLNMIMETIL